MPASYELDAERTLATFRLWGHADAKLIESIGEDLIADPNWDASYDRLWDCREVTQLVLTLAEVKALVARVQTNWQSAHRVVIVARRVNDLEIAKLIQAFMRERPVEVFSDIEAAYRFLERR